MPPFANAHDHARGVRPTALGAFDLPLELWLATMTGTPACDPWLVVAAALGRQALGGCGAVMVHYTRPQRPERLEEELRDVVRAARAVGVRVAIAVSMRDRNALGYAPDERILAMLPPEVRELVTARFLNPPPQAAEQMRIADALAASCDDPLIDVQYGPYGLEWCSDAMLAAIAERSALTGRRVHMHLLESRVQREYLDAEHPEGPVRHLDHLGLLSPRLSIAHATWLRPEEMELLAERGVAVSVNTSSNLHLRNGIAPMAEMHRLGVPLATGLDGFSVDDDDDGFRELRLNALLHRGVSLNEGVPLDALFRAACHGGRGIVTGERAADTALLPGGPADAMVLDRTGLAADLLVEVPDMALVAQRAARQSLRHLVVAGREVVRDGRLTGLDLAAVQAELDAQARHGAEGYSSWLDAVAPWRDALRGFYEAGMHRCR
ncbi:amidohydrolase family protein [Roseomonas populi]|uniref:Amidohydrolase family protein n=1 Tax=Roseomonas populi TaxID=3121582 RepID=A0ABT1XCY6_9PROT|nr:amidohydrolase family protein [Roseomonas pecuniae]MCR0985584.1 amidohydrolase family protein [Roseomonas pecuniae]